MSHCDSIVRILADHPSRLEKEAILTAEVEAGNEELFAGFRWALDGLISFGVKKVPKHSGPDGQGLPFEAFKELCELLATRQLTGDAARNAIELALSASKQGQWNDWYHRILTKDLKCGISESTINKVLKKTKPEWSVPVFECMLAHDGANHEKKITGKKLLEIKLDGVRCITIINAAAKTVEMYSRNGKPLSNFTHITDGLLANIDKFDRSWMLDGEVVSSSFQALMKQVHRKSDVQSTDARLMAFDIIPLSEFKAGKSTMGQKRRSKLLKSFAPIFDAAGSIDVIEQTEVDLDGYVGELQFKEFNKQAIDNGFEGIMIKDVDAIYESKRSVSWLKMKPFIEVSLSIVDVEEGTGKNEGRMGAIICEGEDDGKIIRVNVGSGFTDEQRIEFWATKESLVGQVVEVRADAATRNQDSEAVWSLRFPRFLRFRGFKTGEKL